MDETGPGGAEHAAETAPEPTPGATAEPAQAPTEPVAPPTPAPPEVDEALLRPVWPALLALAFRRGARPVAAAVLPVLPVAVLGVLLIAPFQVSTEAVTVNGRLDALDLPGGWLAAGAGLLLLAAAAVLLGAGAAGLLAAATLTGRTRTVRWALGAALRRTPTLLAFAGLGIVLCLPASGAVLAVLLAGGPLPFALVVGAVVATILLGLAPLAWPVALVEGRGAGSALARSWRLVRGARGWTTFALAVLGYLLPGLVLLGVDRVLDALAGPVGVWWAALLRATVAPAVATVAVAVLAAFRVGLLVATASGHTLVRYDAPALDRDRVDAALDAGDGDREWRAVPRRPVPLALATVVALLLPGAASTALLHENPLGVPSYAVAEARDDASNMTVRPLPAPDGSTVGLVAFSTDLLLYRCHDTACGRANVETDGDENSDGDPSWSPLPLAGGAAVVAPDGRVVASGWRSVPRENREGGFDDLRLVTCRPADCTEDLLDEDGPQPPVVDHFRPRDPDDHLVDLDVVTAIAASGTGYVIASVQRDLATDTAPVTLYRCADTRCRNPSKVRLGSGAMALHPYAAEVLSVAVGRDGTPAVTLADTRSGAVRLFACDDAACEHPAVRDVAPGTGRATYDVQTRAGAQVAIGPSGAPAVTWRDSRTGTPMLALCAGRSCSTWTTRRLTGPGWAHPWPALALDEAGRPLVATYDLARRRLVLVSCDDALRCAHPTTRALAAFRNGPGNADLAIDADGRPRIAWTDAAPASFMEEGPLRVLRCTERRCGVP